MAPAEIKSARQRLGLTQQGLADALHMGANGGRTVRRWEAGEVPITGPARVAIELLVGRLVPHGGSVAKRNRNDVAK